MNKTTVESIPNNRAKGKAHQGVKTTDGRSALPPLPPLPPLDPENVRALLDTQRTVVDGILAVNRELLDFAEARLHADIEAMDGLCQCKDWQQFVDLQSRFLSTMTTQYFDRTARLMTAASKMLATARTGNGAG